MAAADPFVKHWKAYIKIVNDGAYVQQREAVVAAHTEYEAVTKFRERFGTNCIIGWIKETRLYGLQSIM